MGIVSNAKGVLRSLALWLGLIALTVQGLVPLCVSASGQAIVICTVHGYETITVNADGAPVSPAPSSDHSSCFLCIGCQLGAGFTTPELVAFAEPGFVSSSAPAIADQSIPQRRAYSAYASRAPPALSLSIAV